MRRKNNPDNKSIHIRKLVQEFIRVFLVHVSQYSHEIGWDQTPTTLFSTEIENILIEIGQELKGSTAFRDLNDLAQFLSDALLAIFTATKTTENLDISYLAAHLTDRLANPLQTFSFHAPLTLKSELSFCLNIGGEHTLEVTAADQAKDGMFVMGRVNAATEPSAIVAVEELIAALLGILHVIDLCIIVPPLPGSRHNTSVTMTPHDETIPSEMSADVSAGIMGTIFRVPNQLTDLEKRLIQDDQLDRGFARHVRQINRVMASADDQARKLRRAAGLLLKASVTRDTELAITYAFMCLEGVLLEPTVQENVLSRLIEAVAYRIGTSPSHRTELRREVRELYNVRSRYVHTGVPSVSALANVRKRCLMIVGEVLRREIQTPDDVMGSI